MDVLTIQSDEVALQAIKENTRPRYLKLWKDFKEFTGDESLDTRVPSEDEILNFVRHLRDDKGIFNCIFNICSICNICYIIGMASRRQILCLLGLETSLTLLMERRKSTFSMVESSMETLPKHCLIFSYLILLSYFRILLILFLSCIYVSLFNIILRNIDYFYWTVLLGNPVYRRWGGPQFSFLCLSICLFACW